MCNDSLLMATNISYLQDKGINIETTKIGQHNSDGVGKIYMRFTRDLTPDVVDYVKNEIDNLESCVGCVIHKSPQIFQIEQGKINDIFSSVSIIAKIKYLD